VVREKRDGRRTGNGSKIDSLITMRTILLLICVGWAGTALAQVDTARNVVNSTVRGTEKAARTVAHGAKTAVDKVADVFIPEPDAHRVDVSLNEDKIDMPGSVEPGKTAFVVKNSGKTTKNFELAGHGIDREFLNPPKPGQTKVLHATLRQGTYSVYSPSDDGGKRTEKMSLRVK
jgi:hypothetical protein